MRSRFALALGAAAALLTACAKDKPEEGERAAAGPDGSTPDPVAEGGATPASSCDAGGELAAFLDVFAKGEADAALEKIGFPFSGDTGNWIKDEQEIRQGIKAGGKPFESLAINDFDESKIAERNKKWVEEVRGEYPDVIVFDVIATRQESHTKMSAYWFVDPNTCKIVGMDDY